jgi:hypothetical protein
MRVLIDIEGLLVLLQIFRISSGVLNPVRETWLQRPLNATVCPSTGYQMPQRCV